MIHRVIESLSKSQESGISTAKTVTHRCPENLVIHPTTRRGETLGKQECSKLFQWCGQMSLTDCCDENWFLVVGGVDKSPAWTRPHLSLRWWCKWTGGSCRGPRKWKTIGHKNDRWNNRVDFNHPSENGVLMQIQNLCGIRLVFLVGLPVGTVRGLAEVTASNACVKIWLTLMPDFNLLFTFSVTSWLDSCRWLRTTLG